MTHLTIPSAPSYRISPGGEVLGVHGKPLKPWKNKKGYLRVRLYADGDQRRFVHVLVAEVYLGPKPSGLQVCHRDGTPANNHYTNLEYGTGTKNVLDSVAHGTHHGASRKKCSKGHEFTSDNTLWITRSKNASRNAGQKYRRCRMCSRAQQREARERRKLETRSG